MKNKLAPYLKAAWSRLPAPARKAVAGIERQIASTPSTYYDPAVHPARLERGAIVISFDFEMAWGWQHQLPPSIDFVRMGLWERAQIPGILKALDGHAIPTTWFTVGHLFLDRCACGRDGRAHPDMVRLAPGTYESYRFDSGDWYQNDPCTDVHRDPAWYAPDLVEMILKSSVVHEIGCHTFSHAYLGPPCSDIVAESELNASINAMARFGMKPESFSFPRESEGNFESIARAGFSIVRASTGRRAILSLPVLRRDGVWAVHASTTIDRGARWSLEERLARLKKFADAAVRERLAFHMFLHPSLSAEELNSIFVPFLAYCADQREHGLLDVVTVRDLVRLTQERKNPHSI
jgi:peptidoglycan/xylan/chitin deacetylase (PgdA/CDA1 family)